MTPSAAPTPPPRIRVGIGGWTYAPWRAHFYPAGLPQAQELAHASRHVTAIEINGTFYGTHKPATFAKWRDDTPEGFVFSMKAPRYCTHRRVLAQAGPSIERFIASGIAQLQHKLGPVVWQFPPAKAFEPDDFAAFLDLLPPQAGDRALRHVLEVRHASFMTPHFLALARAHRCAVVYTDAAKYPSLADPTADFVYARLMRARADVATGYPATELDQWRDRARQWRDGTVPPELPRIDAAPPAPLPAGRDVFVYFINGAKENAPAAAMALLERL